MWQNDDESGKPKHQLMGDVGIPIHASQCGELDSDTAVDDDDGQNSIGNMLLHTGTKSMGNCEQNQKKSVQNNEVFASSEHKMED